MGGGLMQLVAMGAQDVYLTGNPQITFFKVVYRRHTNFSKECIAQQFSGNPGFGSSVTCTLARNGDLVQEIYLRAVLKCTTTGTATDEDFFKLSDVTNLIKTVEVEIGGQKIDKHYSQWLDIYNELFETSHDYRYVMNSAEGGTADANVNVDATVYIPLRFWFNRNPGLALPLIALQYHEVKVNVTLGAQEDFFALAAGDATAAAAGPLRPTDNAGTGGPVKIELSSADLLVNYLYLDTDERRRFAQVSHEYLIEQVQHTGAETEANIDMTFNHPVKALFWSGKTWNNVKLQLNGHDRAAVQSHDYYHLVQPYECGLGHSGKQMNGTRGWDTVSSGRSTASTVGMYSFCLKPAEHQPSGTCNFSRIDNARLNVGTADASGLYLFAMNYNVLRIMSGMGGLAYSN
jgi:hypothetical protein